MNKKPLKGMRDFLPQDAIKRNMLRQLIVENYLSYGYSPIETPSLEDYQNIHTNESGENSKIAFNVLKRGDKLNLDDRNLDIKSICDMGLRFDLTLPLTRFYANNANSLPSPFKVFQIGDVWRGERPQKGRYRQFMQCDVDIIGDKTINAELDLLRVGIKTLQKLGLNDFVISINDRRLLNDLMNLCEIEQQYYEKVLITLDKLDKIGEEKVIAELLQIGLSEVKSAKLLKMITNLDLHTLNNYYANDLLTVIEVINTVSEKISIVFDPTLVRGMGYYTGMVFEIKDKKLNLSIAGGGRYDNLIGKFMNNDVPACGFSLGFERILLLLDEKKYEVSCQHAVLIDELASDKYIELLEKIANVGFNVSILTKKKNLKKQLDDLVNSNYQYYCVYEDELDFKELNNA